MSNASKNKGLILMVVGVSFISLGEAVVKLLTLNYSPFQILFIRSLIALPFLLILWKKDKHEIAVFDATEGN